MKHLRQITVKQIGIAVNVIGVLFLIGIMAYVYNSY